jgi:hypothetical protein
MTNKYLQEILSRFPDEALIYHLDAYAHKIQKLRGVRINEDATIDSESLWTWPVNVLSMSVKHILI